MKCPNCGVENRKEANFCANCGHKIELPCVRCDHHNPPRSKFCEKCGTRLIESAAPISRALSYDEKLQNIQKYLPEGLREKSFRKKTVLKGSVNWSR